MNRVAPVVSLREITPANGSTLEALTVTETQSEYVAGVAESLVEAAETPDACPWFRAVYVDEEPVGFVMLSDGITVDHPDYLGPYYLWRLLSTITIRARATAALRLGCGRARAHSSGCAGSRHLVGARTALPRRLLCGSRLSADGVIHTDDEMVLELDLSRTPAGPSRS